MRVVKMDLPREESPNCLSNTQLLYKYKNVCVSVYLCLCVWNQQLKKTDVINLIETLGLVGGKGWEEEWKGKNWFTCILILKILRLYFLNAYAQHIC